ncbi:MAG: hypothetical protein IJ394_03145 [Bacteroidales bacterium]|nr:hypothetical protein [Bacteroidales bacterium]
MKKLFLSFLMCLMAGSFTATAQVADNGVEYRLGHYRVGGEKLTDVQVAGMLSSDAYSDYLSGRRLYKSGVIVMSVGAGIVGASALLFGSMFLPAGSDSATDTPGMPLGTAIVSLGGAITGGVVMAAGVPLLCVGDRRLKDAVGNVRSPQLTLGPTAHGVGFNFTF